MRFSFIYIYIYLYAFEDLVLFINLLTCKMKISLANLAYLQGGFKCLC